MLVVKIELHSAITDEIKTIATGKIINTGAGTASRGSYRVDLKDARGRPWKAGTVAGFPRTRLLAWDLLACALYSILGKRNSLTKCANCGGKLTNSGVVTVEGGN